MATRWSELGVSLMATPDEASFIDQLQDVIASGGDISSYDVSYDVGLVEIDDDPQTPLFVAAMRGWCAAIKWLITRGVDLEAGMGGDNSGIDCQMTPLSVIVSETCGDEYDVSSETYYDAAVLLLDAGARVDTEDIYFGKTLLHECMNEKMARLLLIHGASPGARDDKGQLPEDDARTAGHTALAEFLSDVRTAGGWQPWVDAPRAELRFLRRRLPLLRERGRAAPSSSVPLHENLFLKVPTEVFTSVLQYWRGPRDPGAPSVELDK